MPLSSELTGSSFGSTGSAGHRNVNASNANGGSKNGPGDTPMRSTRSMQPSSGNGGDGSSSNSGSTNGFINPFTSPTFRFNPLASARVRNAGSAMQNASSHDSAFTSPRQQTDGGLSANAFGSDPPTPVNPRRARNYWESQDGFGEGAYSSASRASTTATGSSTASIPDFPTIPSMPPVPLTPTGPNAPPVPPVPQMPVPTYQPQRRNLGPPPSARRGASSYY